MRSKIRGLDLNSLVRVIALAFVLMATGWVIVREDSSSITTELTGVSTSSFGEDVMFTALVVDHTENGYTPGGVVSFYDGNVLLGSKTLVGNSSSSTIKVNSKAPSIPELANSYADNPLYMKANAEASVTLSNLSPGEHTIVAIYEGDGNHNGSISQAVTHIVEKLDSVTTLHSVSPTIEYATNITFTASVASGSASVDAAPTGTVTFMDGTVILGTSELDEGGIAKLSKRGLMVDTHLVQAIYNGDSLYAVSESSQLLQKVQLIKTETLLTISRSSIAYGDTITLNAAVSNSSANPVLPNGGVVFFMNGSTTLGQFSAVNGAASMMLSTLEAGEYSLTAEYKGDATHSSSISQASALVVDC